MPAEIYLTKSRYTAGLQCPRRLWLNVHEPRDWDEPETGSTADIGIEIGRMARLLLPGGILGEEPPWEHAAAVARTIGEGSRNAESATREAAGWRIAANRARASRRSSISAEPNRCRCSSISS